MYMLQNWVLFFILIIITAAVISRLENKPEKIGISAAAAYFFMIYFFILIILNALYFGDLFPNEFAVMSSTSSTMSGTCCGCGMSGSSSNDCD